MNAFNETQKFGVASLMTRGLHYCTIALFIYFFIYFPPPSAVVFISKALFNSSWSLTKCFVQQQRGQSSRFNKSRYCLHSVGWVLSRSNFTRFLPVLVSIELTYSVLREKPFFPNDFYANQHLAPPEPGVGALNRGECHLTFTVG